MLQQCWDNLKMLFRQKLTLLANLADFFRFGVQVMTDIYKLQPQSASGMWNYNEFRPLEGFVFALTPFNFTSIAGNLPAAPALMGEYSGLETVKNCGLFSRGNHGNFP